MLQDGVEWVRTHQEQFWATSGTALAATLMTFFMIHRHQLQNDEAWSQLGTAQGQLLQNRYEEASKSLKDWTVHYANTSAETYAGFLRADLLYRTSDYASAARVYGNLAQNGRPPDARPLALAAEAAAEEMAGRIPQAQALAQQFMDHYPDHFLAASVSLAQARLAELARSSGDASSLYDRFIMLYPQSPWVPVARARLRVLSNPSRPPKP